MIKNDQEERQIISNVSDLSIKTKSFKIFAHKGGIINSNSLAYEVAESEFSFTNADAGKWFRISLLLLKSGGVGILVIIGDQSSKYRPDDPDNLDYEDIGPALLGRISSDGTKFDFYQKMPIVTNFFLSKNEQFSSRKESKNDRIIKDEPVQDTIVYIPTKPQIRRVEVVILQIITPTLESIKEKNWSDLNCFERDLLLKTFAEQSGLIQK